MAASDLLVRVQELGGTWLPIGTEKSRGIWVDPSDFSADADDWGSRQMQMRLRYDPRVLQPHISAFTPGELEIGGIPCWSGREKESPSQDGQDRSISPSFEGWQNHLDDDAYQQMYVHTNLADWQDARQGISTQLSASEYAAEATVSSDGQGLPILGQKKDGIVLVNRRVGIYLDLGPDSTAIYASVDWQSSNNQALETLHVRGQTTPNFGSGDSSFGPIYDAGTAVNNAAASGTISGAFGAGCRYVSIFFVCTGGYTAAADIWFRLTGIRLFQSSAYQSGGQSILVGSTIVKDAIARGTLLLSPDLTQVMATTFQIPEFNMTAYQTTRAVIVAATAFDDVTSRVTVEKQPSVRARPTLPIYEVGDWSGAEFQDASTNSGDQIYSSVEVSGTDAAGAQIRVRRNQIPYFFSPSPIQPTNPSATVDTSSWAAGLGGTLSRDTVTFDTTPGSFKVVLAAAGPVFQGGMSSASWSGGTFVPGQTYQVTFRFGTSAGVLLNASATDANGAGIGSLTSFTGAAFATISFVFTPQTSGNVTIAFFAGALGAGNFWIDSVTLQAGTATLVDRRNFRRTFTLDTNLNLTGAAAAAIGDVFLASHRFTPFKGTLVLNGPGSIRKLRGGQSVTMAELLRNTGELIQFSHLTDPDTGGLGRYGRIASVALNGPWSASVQIDSTNDNLQKLINRIQTNTAQVR